MIILGNLDIAVLQPIFQAEARDTIADLYAGFMDKKVFLCLMDQVVQDVNLEGSTPKEPKKYVRTMIVNDFENTINPQVKFHWSDAENPDDFDPNWRLLADEYWEAEKNKLFKPVQEDTGEKRKKIIDELDNLRRFY